jgi:type III pantothenate kinase
MQPAIVVDIGNSRIKWGRCSAAPPSVTEIVSLSPDDPAEWERQHARWTPVGTSTWAVSGVHPERRDRFIQWLQQHGHTVLLIDDPQQLPLQVALEKPRGVGIDRLLNAVAANSRRRPHVPAVIVGAGSAITVDWVDAAGTFAGGAILPGLRLMAHALHDYTALLPIVEVQQEFPPVPGVTTVTAMQAGIFWAAVGGIRALISELAGQASRTPDVWLTGGDGPLLHPALDPPAQLWPEMTLEGTRLAAEAL